ncbi:MAG: hypothetical protein ACKVVP_15265 [Chloroflexota bacterium]
MLEPSPNGPAPSATLPGAAPASPEAPAPLAPLVVSGLVVSRADLIQALRVYVPLLTDLSPLDDERYLLHLPAPVRVTEEPV